MSDGHKLAEVWSYSLRQAGAFVKLAGRRRSDLHAELILATRMAYHADGKKLTEYLKQLE